MFFFLLQLLSPSSQPLTIIYGSIFHKQYFGKLFYVISRYSYFNFSFIFSKKNCFWHTYHSCILSNRLLKSLWRDFNFNTSGQTALDTAFSISALFGLVFIKKLQRYSLSALFEPISKSASLNLCSFWACFEQFSLN